MKCNEVLDRLSEYIEKSLSEPAMSQITEHITGCASCRQEMEELKCTLNIMHNLPRQEPVFDLWEEFAARFAETAASMEKERKRENISYIPRLIGTIKEGWAMFKFVAGYNTAKKIRYISGAE
ncbi:MAG: anti-sigma factor family protein [Armatimonadota bacterium]